MAAQSKDMKRDRLVMVGRRASQLKRGDVVIVGGKALRVVSNKSLGTGEHRIGFEPTKKELI
jgi:translation elongation factor P/translation initiation factor 5A